MKTDRDIIIYDICGILIFSIILTGGLIGVAFGYPEQLYTAGTSLLIILLCYREFKLLTDKKQKQFKKTKL